MENKLLQMLTYRRRAWTKGEENFIRDFIDVIPSMRVDDFGNRWLIIGEPTTMFSCHTDTVHGKDGGSKQGVLFDPYLGEAYLSGKAKAGSVLGADDAAGCYILLRMIEANVPGLYVFHRAEEIGGQGSHHFAKADPSGLLQRPDFPIKHCVAFDRRGFDSVITHQSFERTCSDTFAEALAARLGDLDYRKDNTGSFTDSANYTGLIPECTNLSCGYACEHSIKETLNIHFVDDLAERCIEMQWSELPAVRDVNVTEYDTDNDRYYWNNYGDSSRRVAETVQTHPKMNDRIEDYYSVSFDTWEDAYHLATTDPEYAADLLLAYCGTSFRKSVTL